MINYLAGVQQVEVIGGNEGLPIVGVTDVRLTNSIVEKIISENVTILANSSLVLITEVNSNFLDLGIVAATGNDIKYSVEYRWRTAAGEWLSHSIIVVMSQITTTSRITDNSIPTKSKQMVIIIRNNSITAALSIGKVLLLGRSA